MFEEYENKNEIKSENTAGYAESYEASRSAYDSAARDEYRYAKKQRKSGLKTVVAVALSVVVIGSSALFGFFGASLANRTNGITSGGATTVVYQAVKTSDENSNAEPLSVADVAAAVKDSVVEITTEVVSTNGRLGQLISTGAGSGVIITSDGYIVTNDHVISGARKITVRLSDGSEHEATLIGTDKQTDLAVLKINKTDLQPAILGNSSTLKVGEKAIVVGNPLGELGGTVTDGIISALDREITIDGETMSLLQTNAAINPGNSGGGLFNENGELVGVVNAKSSGSDIEGLGFAIPIDTAKNTVEQIMENGYVTGRVDSGFTLIDISDPMTAMTYRVNKLGLYISESKDASFLPGDMITAVDGGKIEGQEDFTALIKKHAVGDTVNITVLRSGVEMTIPLTLGELKN